MPEPRYFFAVRRRGSITIVTDTKLFSKGFVTSVSSGKRVGARLDAFDGLDYLRAKLNQLE